MAPSQARRPATVRAFFVWRVCTRTSLSPAKPRTWRRRPPESVRLVRTAGAHGSNGDPFQSEQPWLSLHSPFNVSLSLDILRGLTIAFMIMVNNNGGPAPGPR